jgi:phospholipid N-methyltransferase
MAVDEVLRRIELIGKEHGRVCGHLSASTAKRKEDGNAQKYTVLRGIPPAVLVVSGRNCRVRFTHRSAE